MSKKFLEDLLKEEINILKKEDNFQRAESDKKAHKFTVSRSALKNEMYQQLTLKKYAPPAVINSPEMSSLLEKLADKIVTSSYNYMKRESNKTSIRNLKKRGDGFSVLVITYTKKFRQIGGKTQVDSQTVFESVKASYKGARDTAVKEINKLLAASGQQQSIVKEYDFLDLDHKAGSVISRQEVNISKARTSQKALSYENEDGEDSITKEDLESLGLTFFVSKNDTANQTTMAVGLRAANLNRGLDSTQQKAFKQKWLEKLEEAVAKLNKSNSFANRQGSDSRTQIERKKIIKAFDDSVKGKKNVKKKTVDTKITLSKNKKVEKKVGKKTKKGTQKKVPLGPLKIARQRPAKSSANSMITLGALINEKLPATVAKNMGLPALQYRTGRFANSVRVTDVTRTTKGFPSIGYTYRRNPYQTFEPGGRQGSQQRDPRKLIDKSIREIAAELLVGRFYTRRV